MGAEKSNFGVKEYTKRRRGWVKQAAKRTYWDSLRIILVRLAKFLAGRTYE